MTSNTKSWDFEGGSTEEAIKKALETLKVSRETINVRVICEEQKGLFGMGGASPAKIKVTIKNKKT